MSESNIHGMIATLNGTVTKMTVDMNHVCTTSYTNVDMYQFNTHDIFMAMPRLVKNGLTTPLSREDLAGAYSIFAEQLKGVFVNYLKMSNGDIICTVHLGGKPMTAEGNFIILTPTEERWWCQSQPLRESVEAIQSLIPEFKPWLGSWNDILLSVLRKVNPEAVRSLTISLEDEHDFDSH
ncbi:hypothetical protein [Yersinia phage vB_YenM_P778]